jgi:hypothetical protein
MEASSANKSKAAKWLIPANLANNQFLRPEAIS